MRKVYSIADNIFAPLGFSTQENWESLCKNESGVAPIDSAYEAMNYAYASVFNEEKLSSHFTKFSLPSSATSKLEKMFIASISEALQHTSVDITSSRTLFVFATTKGNIDLLDHKEMSSASRIKLFDMAEYVTKYFGNPNKPMVISNACISGVLAIEVASNIVRRGVYDQVVVTGGDLVTMFTLSGFHCFQALCKGICKPFDKDRSGINLGEAAATMILSAQPQSTSDIEIVAGATSNDANHISGPSRTGEGLARAIDNAVATANIGFEDIQYLLTHGTATLFNDEMEAKAIESKNLSHVPTNSIKAYYGHTLGAAGILETIVAMQSMKNNLLIKSLGYENSGISTPLNIITKNKSTQIKYAMKTASGFGGCNAALILKKHE